MVEHGPEDDEDVLLILPRQNQSCAKTYMANTIVPNTSTMVEEPVR